MTGVAQHREPSLRAEGRWILMPGDLASVPLLRHRIMALLDRRARHGADLWSAELVVAEMLSNAALHAMADALLERQEEILEANERDLEAGRANGLSSALMDRLIDIGLGDGLIPAPLLPLDLLRLPPVAVSVLVARRDRFATLEVTW